MDRITRKTLKTDKFATEVTHLVEDLAERRRQVTIYASVIGAVLVLGIAGFLYWQYRRSAAQDALAKALATYRATISEEEQPNRITFRTEAEKNNRALRDLEGVARDYARFKEAKIARYYIGLVYYDMGKMGDAEKQLQKVAAEGQDNVTALARLALADIYLAEGKDEEARKTYEYLIQHPTDTVPASRARLALARYLRPRKPEEARKLLMDLIKTPDSTSGAAGNLLREMGQ